MDPNTRQQDPVSRKRVTNADEQEVAINSKATSGEGFDEATEQSQEPDKSRNNESKDVSPEEGVVNPGPGPSSQNLIY